MGPFWKVQVQGLNRRKCVYWGGSGKWHISVHAEENFFESEVNFQKENKRAEQRAENEDEDSRTTRRTRRSLALPRKMGKIFSLNNWKATERSGREAAREKMHQKNWGKMDSNNVLEMATFFVTITTFIPNNICNTLNYLKTISRRNLMSPTSSGTTILHTFFKRKKVEFLYE